MSLLIENATEKIDDFISNCEGFSLFSASYRCNGLIPTLTG